MTGVHSTENAGKLRRRRLAYYARVLVGLGILSFLLWRFDVSTVLNTFAGANRGLLLVACGAFAIDRVLMAIKWNLLLRRKGIHISHWVALRHYMIGNLIGLFTPGAIGLDIYRVTALSSGGNSHDIAATAVLERMIGLGALLVCLLAAFPFTVRFLPIDDGVLHWLVLGSTAGLLAIAVSVIPQANSWILDRLPLEAFGRVGGWVRRLIRSYNESVSDLGTLAWFSVLTLLEVIVSVVVVYVAAASLDVTASFLVFAVIVPLGFLVSRLPISLDGIGVNEAVYVLGFSAVGYSGEEGLAVALLVRLIRLIVAQIPAAILLMHYNPGGGNSEFQNTRTS